MNDPDQARMLLNMAIKDHRALRAMRDLDEVATEIFGFHVQQAIEKGIKAWLCLLGAPYPKSHDLDALALRLEQAGARIPDEFMPLLMFSDFAVLFRYEAFMAFDESIDRHETTDQVGRFLEHVNQLLQTTL